MQQQRNISLDILRILACIGVITIHTAGSVRWHGWAEPNSIQWNLAGTLDAMSRWSVPIFAMLTGFFFLNPEKEITIKKLFTKNIARIVVALVVWSVFYALTLHKPIYPFGSQEGHFWYLGMCIGLYLAVPVMRIIATNSTLLKYFCWTWLACKLYSFIGKFVVLPFDIIELIFTDYVGYCLWAFYLSTLPKTKTLHYTMSATTLLGLIITIIGYIFSLEINPHFGSYTSPTVIVTSIGLFYLFSHQEIRLSEKWQRTIQFCSESTFGIYLIHMWLLINMFFRVHRFIETPIYVVLICIPAVFFIGWAITAIIKQIPVLKKWIV